jgi:hypothetical protein
MLTVIAFNSCSFLSIRVVAAVRVWYFLITKKEIKMVIQVNAFRFSPPSGISDKVLNELCLHAITITRKHYGVQFMLSNPTVHTHDANDLLHISSVNKLGIDANQ